MHLSIIIPAYNEESRILPTLEEITSFSSKRFDSYEVIVVDDGSSDNTSQVIEKFKHTSNDINLLRFPKNLGKGAAVKAGVLSAKGERIVFADADGSTPFSEIDKLLVPLEDGADIVIGSRALVSKDSKVETSLHRKVFGRIFNFAVNLLLVPDIADTQCGFKLFTRKSARFLFQKLLSEKFSFDVEILSMAQRARMKIVEVPINWHNVPGSKVDLLKDATEMLRDTIRFKFMHRDINRESYQGFVSD